jgi:ferredoxin--NADP+ reductase
VVSGARGPFRPTEGVIRPCLAAAECQDDWHVFEIVLAEQLAPAVKRFRVVAPRVASHWRAGQFVIVRVSQDGERVPLTIADGDADAGWIGIVVQAVGATTTRINELGVGDHFTDVVGPLGTPSEVERVGTVVVVGGGVGTAIAYPVAVANRAAGNRVVSVIGGRAAPYVILEDELRAVADDVIVCTDDGSHGRKGVVTDALADVIARERVDKVVAIGPIPMMRAVADITRPAGIETIVSLNPIMVDGTGMCGGCRVLVGSETKFACVDGPEFHAHEVDFDVLARRNRSYLGFERDRADTCASGEAHP